jgi:hypothetical protein
VAGRYIFPAQLLVAHNGPVTGPQVGAACPQCGSAAAVHSIEELAAMARGQLGQPPGAPATPQPGYAGEPAPGAPQPGGPTPSWAAEPTPGPPQPGGGVPGWAGRTQAGQPRPGFPGVGAIFSDAARDGGSVEDDIAAAALGAATQFLGRKLGRRMQRAYNERVAPALAARQESAGRTQIEIAQRHPDLRACLTDHVIFLAGGSRVLPMPSLGPSLTVEQADALVNQLRGG